MEAVQAPPISRDTQENLVDTLLACMHKVGIRAANVPTKEAFQVLCLFVLKEYAGLTCGEITLAFDLAITRKLDLTDKEIPCYENFSCLYLAGILNSYRRWASLEYRLVEQALPNQKAIAWKEDTTDTGMQEWLNQVILNAQDPAYAVEWIPEQLYDWLEGKGKIPIGANGETAYLLLAEGRRQAWLVYQFTEDPTPKTRAALEKFNLMKSKGCYTGDEIPALLILAKKIVLMQLIIKPANAQLDAKRDRNLTQGRQDIGLQLPGEGEKGGELANGTTGETPGLQAS